MPTDPRASQAPAAAVLLAVVAGLHFAVLQLSYTFLLEAYLSSRTVSYFVTTACWLVGVLLGLLPKRRRLFVPLLGAGALAYYGVWLVIRCFPFRLELLGVAAIGAAGSGLLAGHFFPFAAAGFPRVKLLFLHENNGFLAGSLLLLLLHVQAGERALALAPALSAGLLLLAFLAGRRSPERPS